MNMRTLLPSLWDRDQRPGRPFDLLQSEIDKVFSDFGRGMRWPTMPGDGITADLMPDMDFHESADHVTMTMELPGVDQKDTDISVEDQTITISGEKKMETEKKNGDVYRSERSYGRFARSLTLPFRIDPKAVEARFAKGVLTVSIAKPKEAIARAAKIPIKA